MDNENSFYQKHGTSILAVFAIALTALDVLYLTIYRDVFISPMVSFLSGTFICVFALVAFDRKRVEDFTLGKYQLSILRILAIIIPLAIGIYITAPMLSELITKYPVDHKYSDILPALQNIYIDRFIHGENVYEVYEKFGNPLYPNYLPMQWLPYLVAHGLGIDYRWIAYAIFIFALVLWAVRLLKKPIHWLEILLKVALPFLALYPLLIYRKSSFGSSVELTIVGYYLILAYTLFKKSTITRSVGILLPLLSRFSFLFWLVFYAISSFLTERQNAIKIIKWTTIGVVLLYVLPFFLREPNAFFDGLGYYKKASLFEWHTRHWQTPGDYPFHLKNGVSFSVYFYEYIDGTLEERFYLATLFHKIMSISAALLISLFFWKRKGSDLRLTALVGLKLCITWFYAFLSLPFFYLYLLPVFLSFVIIFEMNIFSISRKFELNSKKN